MTRAWAAALLVSPLQDDHRSLNEILEGSGWRLLYASEWRFARAALHRHRFDVVLTARRFPDGHSWQDVLRETMQTQAAPPVVLLSDAADGSLWAEVLRLGAFDVLLQPLRSEEVAACLNLVQPLVTPHRNPAAGAGTATILVAEAPEVQCFIRNVLERRRYRVLTPAAAEVSRCLAREPVALVITNRPDEVVSSHPQARVLYTCAVPDLDRVRGLPNRALAILHKPFRPDELLLKVRTLLSQPAVGAVELRHRPEAGLRRAACEFERLKRRGDRARRSAFEIHAALQTAAQCRAQVLLRIRDAIERPA